MICSLCGLDKKLIDAHIIPRSFHRIDPNDRYPTQLVTNIKGRYPQKVPKGVYDKTILCEDCERRFSCWDDYGDELFLKKWNDFAPINDRGKGLAYTLSRFDYSLVKMFFLSVLWRASVSSQPMFANVKLGPKELILKEAIWNNEPGNTDFFGIALQAFNSTNVAILNSDSIRFSGLRFYRLYLSHVIAFVKVDSRPFKEPLRSVALSPESPLVVIQKDFLTSPERQIMKDLVTASLKKR